MTSAGRRKEDELQRTDDDIDRVSRRSKDPSKVSVIQSTPLSVHSASGILGMSSALQEASISTPPTRRTCTRSPFSLSAAHAAEVLAPFLRACSMLVVSPAMSAPRTMTPSRWSPSSTTATGASPSSTKSGRTSRSGSSARPSGRRRPPRSRAPARCARPAWRPPRPRQRPTRRRSLVHHEDVREAGLPHPPQDDRGPSLLYATSLGRTITLSAGRTLA